MAQDYFFGIGIDAYQHWPRLNNAVRDVETIAETLAESYQFRPENMRLLLNDKATQQNILDELAGLAEKLNEADGDSLIIYYSGHGHLSNLNLGYWVPVDARPGRNGEYIPNSTIKDLINAIPSKHTVLFSDSCFSGSLLSEVVRGPSPDANTIDERWVEELMKFKSRWALCSGRHDQVVADGPANSHSPFAGSILKILRTPPRSYVTLDYLLDVVRETTRANYDQLPDGRPLNGVGHGGGQYVFRRLGGDAETNSWNALRAMPEANQAQISAKKAAISKFCDQFPRSQYLDAAIKMGNELEARERFNSMAQTEFEYRKFMRDFPDSPLIPQVKEKLRLLMDKKPMPPDSPPSTPAVKDNKMYRWLLLLLLIPAFWLISRLSNKEDTGVSTMQLTGAGEPAKTEADIPEAISSPVPAAIAAIADNMVRVSGGTFTMGCTSEQGGDCYDWEKPAHQVTVSSYEMGKYEVTQAEWRAVMGTNPSNFSGCDACPVEQVSWNDIQEFLSKLNGMTNGGYRLPTEAEWEYAARGGSSSRGYKYAGGNDLGRVAWYDGNSGDKTHPVGQKQANELGLYDMSGNVWEWCSDWYGDYASGAQTNPKGPSQGAGRVYRGGGCNYYALHCRVSNRNDNAPTSRNNSIGFRLARSSNQ